MNNPPTHILLVAALASCVLLLDKSVSAVTNSAFNPGFEDLDEDTFPGDGWGAFGAVGFNAFFGANGHASLFGDIAGNSGGAFQQGITAIPGQRYQFDLLNTRIESAWDADLKLGIEFYAADDTTKLSESIVTLNTAERLALPNVDSGGAANGAVFSAQGVAPVGAAFARPILLMDNVNPAYLGQAQANTFVFDAHFAETPVGGNLLKNPGFGEDFNEDGTSGDLWGTFGNAEVGDAFGGNFHASLFADIAGNSGGFFQQSILGDDSQTYRFTLEDVRIEDSFDADLTFGLEYYGTDDFNKLGEDLVAVDTSTTGDGLSFSFEAIPVAGTAYVRPVILFDNVNPAYLGQAQANAFIFETSLVEVVALDGDYNENGVVDAADYTVWRDAFEAGSTSLPNEVASPGVVDQADYNAWVFNFGNVPGSSSTAIPEPSTLLMVLGGVVACRLQGRRRRSY